MNQYDLNNKIYKCIQWQQYNQPTCSKKRLNKCIISPGEISNWEMPKPKIEPVQTKNSAEHFQFIEPINNPVYTINPASNIKPMNYFPN